MNDTRKNKLVPSILAADFGRLGEQLKLLESAGVDMIHIDVMDGNFVPSISFGMPVIRSIRKETKLPFDVHLMIQEPERYIEEFVECGADSITVHVETCSQIESTIRQIKRLGVRAGVTLNPATSIDALTPVLSLVDMVLVMTVEPGFGGQSYIEACTEKIKKLRERLDQMGLDTDIEVDGGITKENVHVVLNAGANVIVSGTAVFKGDLQANVNVFRERFGKVG